MRILVVEDEHKLAGILKRGLQKHGYAVDVVYNGEDGLAMSEMGEYDLVVLDVMLPGLSGFEVLALCVPTRSTLRS